jgi:hypothetical protein
MVALAIHTDTGVTLTIPGRSDGLTPGHFSSGSRPVDSPFLARPGLLTGDMSAEAILQRLLFRLAAKVEGYQTVAWVAGAEPTR